MMNRVKAAAAMPAAAGFALAACSTPPTQEQAGMVIGGVLGCSANACTE